MATIYQANPNSTFDANNVELYMELTNNDAGAIYNSATLNTLDGLDDALWGLASNQSNYASKDDMVADWGASVQPGEVSNGWSANTNSNGTIDLANNNFFYDIWNTNANSDMLALTVSIPKSQLEVDGIAGYNPLSDAQVVLGGQRQDAYVAMDTNNVPQWQAQGQNYDITVVPEPSSVLMGAALLGAMALRRGTSAARGLVGKLRRD